MMRELFMRLTGVVVLAMSLVPILPSSVHAQGVSVRYANAQAREAVVLKSIAETLTNAPARTRTRVIDEARAVIASYEALVRRYHSSGYADNALFNAAGIAAALHDRFRQSRDRVTAVRLYKRVTTEYPSSSLTRQIAPILAQLDTASGPDAAPAIPTSAARAAVPTSDASERPGRARLTAIERTVLPETVRVTLMLDREVAYHEEKLAGPSRVFFDLKGVEAAPDLVDAVLRFPTDVVRLIRIGRHPGNTVRVVLDLDGVTRHSVYTLYNPFRLVIDAEPVVSTSAQRLPPTVIVETPVVQTVIPVSTPTSSETSAPKAAAPRGESPSSVLKGDIPAPNLQMDTPPPADRIDSRHVRVDGPSPRVETPTTSALSATQTVTPPPVTSIVPAPPIPLAAPASPTVNGAGGFSIARQLGLGVSRVVIDPGHGGHDPGAQAKGMNEADLTLDLALRLEKLLQKEPGLEVVLTRRTNVYIPLEERTAIANREGADLFLSIHANTSRNAAARGVETYFLSFAGSPEAEAVAARENSSHAGEMHKLPDIIKAITLNNKLDESRDLAAMVQEALVTRLRRSNKNVDNRGVKKAPFVVLIGAEMPSVLAEVSFLTNKQELSLLKTATYKQRVAEALHAAVMRYRRSLKGARAVAAQ